MSFDSTPLKIPFLFFFPPPCGWSDTIHVGHIVDVFVKRSYELHQQNAPRYDSQNSLITDPPNSNQQTEFRIVPRRNSTNSVITDPSNSYHQTDFRIAPREAVHRSILHRLLRYMFKSTCPQVLGGHVLVVLFLTEAGLSYLSC